MPRGYTGPSNAPDITLAIDPAPMRKLAADLRTVRNGKVMRAELSKNLRTASKPAVADAKSAIRAAPSQSVNLGKESMRSMIATTIRTSVKFSGNSTGVRITQGSTRRLRGFRFAGRNFNKPSFRHPVYGDRERWVTQTVAPGWFDRAMQKQFYPCRQAVLRAMDATAQAVAKMNRGA